MKVNTVDSYGKKKGTAEVSDSVFNVPLKKDLIHQVVVGMQSNARTAKANTKDRSEVSGGGKKPWRQKGTGRARHGSSRSPIWVGGGIAHGPQGEKDYTKKINSKMRIGALVSVLSEDTRSGKVLFVDTLAIAEPKTRVAATILKAFEAVEGFETLNTLTNKNNALLVVPEVTDDIKRAFRNLPHLTIIDARQLTVLDEMRARYTIIAEPEAVSDVLVGRLPSKRLLAKKEAVTA